MLYLYTMKVTNKRKPLKEEVLNAKLNKTYVTPKGLQYTFVEWYKMGRIYHFIIEHRGKRINFKESDYKSMDLDKCFNEPTFLASFISEEEYIKAVKKLI